MPRNKKSVVSKPSALTIYCALMGTQAIAITKEGVKVSEQYAETEMRAKNALGIMSDNLHPMYDEAAKKAGKDTWNTVWVKAPGAHKGFMNACKYAENMAAAGKDGSEQPAQEAPVQEESQSGVEVITIELPVKYDDHSMAKMAMQLSAKIREKNGLESAKKVSADSYKGQIADVEEAINNIMDKIYKGTTMGSVQCSVEKDAAGKVVKVIRNDTGEEVEGVQQTKLGLDEPEPVTETPENETPADQPPPSDVFHISSKNLAGNLRKVNMKDENGEMISINFGDIQKGNSLQFIDPDSGQIIVAHGTDIFVAQDMPVIHGESLLVSVSPVK